MQYAWMIASFIFLVKEKPCGVSIQRKKRNAAIIAYFIFRTFFLRFRATDRRKGEKGTRRRQDENTKSTPFEHDRDKTLSLVIRDESN